MDTNVYVKNLYKDLLATAAKNGNTVYENELTRLSNLEHVRSLNSNHVSIKEIFRAFWPSFKLLHQDKLRSSIIKNVESMIDCRNLSKGYLFYECSKCDHYHLSGLSCHSRFCSSCGHKYRDSRSLEIQKKLISVPHRHFVFSLPFDLRPFFWKCRPLFDCLFKSVNDSLHFSLDLSKKDLADDARLGFVAFLHTSGRSLNLHPHIDVLIAEATIDKFNKKKDLYFFPFERLRKTFMFKFLSLASKVLKAFGNHSLYREFNILRSKIIKKYKDGFYTYGPRIKEFTKFYNTKKIANYIARYASHPPIAESNILSLDSTNSTVSWRYTPHDDPNNPVVITEHPHIFISRLIRHIHDEGFHQIRYYGFYANKSARANSFTKLVSKSSIDYLKSRLKWRIMLLDTFKFDPLLCSCGAKMVLNIKLSFLPNNNKGAYISDA